MTDNEIIKSYEWCIGDASDKCRECSFENEAFCEEVLQDAVLDLINRRQAEIERLNGYINTNCLDCAGCKQWKCDCSNIKAEAIREFTEKLIAHFNAMEYCANTKRKTVRVEELIDQANWIIHTIAIETINSVKQEMVGDTNAE